MKKLRIYFMPETDLAEVDKQLLESELGCSVIEEHPSSTFGPYWTITPKHTAMRIGNIAKFDCIAYYSND